MTLEAIILDVDGTLAETEEAHRAAFNRAFQALGESWHWDVDLYHDLLAVGGGRERLHHYLERFHPERLADARIRELHTTKTAYYNETVGELPLRPGVAALVQAARAEGLKLGLATTTSRVNVEGLLAGRPEGVGLAMFQAVATGESSPCKKPDPGVYLAALEQLGLPAAACLAVEDAPIGLASARAAGLPCVVTESLHSRGQDFPGALKVLPDLSGVDVPTLRAWHAEATA